MGSTEDSIVRTFGAARKRFADAMSFELQQDELGVMLDQLYRLIELRGSIKRITTEPTTPTAMAIVLFRHKDVHESTRAAVGDDVVTDYFTNVVGALVWSAHPAVASDPRFTAYGTEHLIGSPALDTTIAAFEEVRALD
ncbi:hypothetical protein JNB63_03040 [Microbacterium trichothecenolyticum]|uniref:hypothetical protein n=1 Tax=Microbacterium trichothecenolyticum TaxID=69370 RepID=UPI001C6E51AA|nr:hypothetical protein [Microbacterium trichothecenolyticum]MBW9119059.1 hypothetical protein [Microbacterium trichothecenolyticum]